jgi:DHA1 family tetracycline resistance protein-like MFS transporter
MQNTRKQPAASDGALDRLFSPDSPAGMEAPANKRSASPLLPIFLIVAVDILGFTIILPLLPFYSERLGANPTVVGALVSMYAVCQLISGPILGQLSDRFGRRPILLVSQVGTLAGFFVLAFSSQLWMVFFARALDGATAGNLSTAQAYISDVTKPEERAKSFAIIGVAFGFGFLVGPAISGFLAQYGYQAPIFAACALSFTSILCTFFLLPRREIVDQQNQDAGPAAPGGKRLSLFSWNQYARYFNDPVLARLLLRWVFFSLSFSTFVAGFALFAERRYEWQGRAFGAREVGYLFAFFGFIGIIMQGGIVGRLVKWLGEEKVVMLGFLGTFLGYAGLALTHGIAGLLGTMGFSAILGAGLRPALTSQITQKAGRREQGVIIGLTQSITSLAQIAAPIVGGLLIQQKLLTAWPLWAALLSGAALCVRIPAQPRPE